MSYTVNWRSLLLCLTLLAPAAQAEGLPDLGESSQNDLSPQMERRIGESVVRDLRLRDPAYLEDPEVVAYLDDLGGRLAASIVGEHPDFEFFAMRDPTLNAFALPGGFVGVHTGLILAAQSESELAGVLAHEISHVTQHHIARLVGKEKQATLASLAAIAVAILAARSNAQVAQAAMATGAAANIQSQLNYTRDFEREADRIGMQLLDSAGYDTRAMAAFFERLQKYSRLYENNAPAYLRTHPLTTERIADMDNRAQQRPYRQVPDSVGFQLVRAKLRSEAGTPEEAVTDFETQLKERKYASEGAARYGAARALLRAKNVAAADKEVAVLRRLKVSSPMVDTLAAEVKLAEGDPASALKALRDGRQHYPQDKALAYSLIDTLLSLRRADEALQAVSGELRLYPGDAQLWALQAKSYAALGKHLQQHRSQAEAYALQGQLSAAVEQLQLAQKAGDGDFYEQSAVDARLRELRIRLAEEMKEKKQGQ